jgi:hypothetical protein
MERIGVEFEREVRRFGSAGTMPALVEAWPAVVGDTIARHAWPARVSRDRTLLVNTSSSTWAFELTQLAPTILGRLSTAVGEDAPQALRFAPGPIPEPPAEPPPTIAKPSFAATADATARARELTAQISDAELRERVAGAAALSLSTKMLDRSF